MENCRGIEFNARSTNIPMQYPGYRWGIEFNARSTNIPMQYPGYRWGIEFNTRSTNIPMQYPGYCWGIEFNARLQLIDNNDNYEKDCGFIVFNNNVGRHNLQPVNG